MKKLSTTLAAALQSLCMIAATVPVEWTETPRDRSPRQFTARHGETLRIRCTLAGFDGEIEGDPRLYFQTNGMGRLWWDAPATAASNRIEAVFGAAQDVGADRVNVCLGSPSNAYASAVLRLLPSPGFTPASLSPPVLSLDFASLAWSNAPWATTNALDDAISSLAQAGSVAVSAAADASTNYTDRATNAVLKSLAPTLAAKQDALPYPTNAIPYAAIADVPDAADYSTNNAALVATIAATSLEPATDYTDGVASALLGGISRKADMYRYEGGATSNVLVSCDWWHSSIHHALVEREDMGEDTWYFSSGELRPPRLGGPTYLLTYQIGIGWVLVCGGASSDDTFATNQQDRAAAVLDFGSFTLVRTNEVWAAETNRYPVVYRDELGGTVSNIVTKSYVEDLGIESGLQEETDPVWSTEKSGYATTSALAAVSNAAASASLNADTALRLVMGEKVWFLVTNYMRTVEGVLPSLELWEARDGETNLVYSSKEEITNLVQDVIHDCRTNLEATVAAATNEMPSKAWGRYQSSGADNPQPGEVLLVNEPTVIMTGGGEWNRYVETGGSSVWVLQSNGHVTFGGDTNGNFFAVKDDEGDTHFKVARTDSYEVDALPAGTGWSGGDFVVTYSSNVQPVLYATTNLTEAFVAESGGRIDALGIDVSWTHSGTNYVATIQQDARHPALFVHAKVTQEGGVAIINSAPTRFDGGIQIGNQKYSIGTYNDGARTFLTLEATP